MSQIVILGQRVNQDQWQRLLRGEVMLGQVRLAESITSRSCKSTEYVLQQNHSILLKLISIWILKHLTINL